MINSLIKNIIFFALGALCCYFLHTYTSVDSVTSSALVGLIFSFVFKKDQTTIYCGSFAGMSTKVFMINNIWFIPVCFLGGLIFFYTKNHLLGFGGKLGTIAFISVSSLLLIRLFL